MDRVLFLIQFTTYYYWTIQVSVIRVPKFRSNQFKSSYASIQSNAGVEMRKMEAGPLRSDPAINGSNVTQPIRGQLQTVVNPGEVVYDCSYSGTLHLHTREDCSLVCSTVASRVHDCLSLHWSHLWLPLERHMSSSWLPKWLHLRNLTGCEVRSRVTVLPLIPLIFK